MNQKQSTSQPILHYSLILLAMLFIVGGAQIGHAQETQWASSVIEVSSERDTVKNKGNFYQAVQALGRPNKMPLIGESILAWSPSRTKKRANEWIKLGFEKPMRIRQVAVAENWGAGSITQIIAYGASGQQQRIYHDKFNKTVPKNGQILRAYCSLTSFEVVAIKLILSTIDIEGYNQVDAVGISASTEPINAGILLSEEMIVESVEPITSINSKYTEVNPIISPDGLRLYVTRKNHPRNTWSTYHNDDIWYIEWNGKKWSNPIQMDKPLNNREHNFVAKVMPDGKLLLGNRYTGSGGSRPGVSMSQPSKEGWAFPEPLEIDGYYNYHKYSEFCISDNQKVLILSIERRDSYGDKDMYVSFLQDDGIWTLPKNMGPSINTPMGEASPYIASDNKTMYFSSSGYSGYGMNDIYVTRRLDSTWCNWSEPMNLGKPFNNEGWNGYFSLDAKGEYAYFISSDSVKNMDVFRAKLPSDARPDPVVLISGVVYNDKTKKPIAAKVVYESLKTGETLGFATSDSITGSYKLTLPYHEKYGIYASAQGFFSIDDFLDLDTLTETYVEIKKDLHLVPIEVGKSVRLNNVFFRRSKATLLPSSYPELNRLARMMKEHKGMKIQLEGHTDIVGDPVLNMKLSQSRVDRVKAYLVSQGVAEKQIKTKAFGSTKPITRERNGDSQRINRRVEVKFLKV